MLAHISSEQPASTVNASRPSSPAARTPSTRQLVQPPSASRHRLKAWIPVRQGALARQVARSAPQLRSRQDSHDSASGGGRHIPAPAWPPDAPEPPVPAEPPAPMEPALVSPLVPCETPASLGTIGAAVHPAGERTIAQSKLFMSITRRS